MPRFIEHHLPSTGISSIPPLPSQHTNFLLHPIAKYLIACSYNTKDKFLKKLYFACTNYPNARSTENAHGCIKQYGQRLLPEDNSS